ncbi:HPr family phosphocarrier protein [Anaerobacillus sp. CMMVII]|uniref:HPr family phosphocarrier protein n=1 Tax=Anaerobacillus sp. CMMVII TaxID=2755588 RepID=UPI0021B7363B|nr:HPr family phosphocarrier protein [Anaerobacillus sp. CMMVII]MCT8137178.1 HPr family phosphocarrier protein [Anaerobacillus sp. CMMVII]
MEKECIKEITVNISEDQTITDLSKSIQPLESEIYLKKMVRGMIVEVNLKSFLGLITLQLKNDDKLIIRAVGEDCDQAVAEIEKYLT